MKTAGIEKEKRRFERVVFRQPIEYRVQPAGELFEETGPAIGNPLRRLIAGSAGLNVSEDGVRCLCPEFLPLEARVVLSFELKPESTVELEGRVVWVQKTPHAESYQVGMKFTEISSNVQPKQELKQYVGERLSSGPRKVLAG